MTVDMSDIRQVKKMLKRRYGLRGASCRTSRAGLSDRNLRLTDGVKRRLLRTPHTWTM